MLERTSACIEQSSRVLLRAPKKCLQRKKTLHSAFWNHGAGEINLPSWWLALLRRQPLTNSSTSRSIADTAKQCLTAGLENGNFMEFLYPAKTLALIHKLAVRDTHYLSSRGKTRSMLRRAYSKRVPDAEVEEEVDEEEEPEHSEEEDPVAILEKQLALESDANDAEDLIAALQHAPNPPPDPPSEEVLLHASRQHIQKMTRRFEKAEAENAGGFASLESAATELLELLDKALKNRASYLVKRMESTESRVGIRYFATAVRAYFHAGDTAKALHIYQEALSQHQDHEATPAVLELAVRSKNWRFGYRAWHIYQQAPHDEKFFWRVLGDMDVRDLVERAIGLAVFARNATVRRSSSGPRVGAFATAFIEVVFQRRDLYHRDIPANAYYDLFTLWDTLIATSATASQYSAILERFLSMSQQRNRNAARIYSAYAVRVFDVMQQRTSSFPEQRIMEQLFTSACRIAHSSAAKIFQALKSNYGPPSIDHYKLMLNVIERDQDVNAFYSMLEEIQEQHTLTWNADLISRVMRMHSRRHEVADAQSIFDRTEHLTGEKPTRAHHRHLIAAYVRAGGIKSAEQKLEEMKQSGLETDAYTYRPFLKFHSLRGDKDALVKVGLSFLDDAKPVHNFVVEAFVLVLVQTDELDEARALLMRAQEWSVIGSKTLMWNYVLNAYARQRNYKEVIALHEEMCLFGIQEDAKTYWALITALNIARQPDQAYFILRKVLQERSIVPDTYLYASIMAAYVRQGKPRRALKLHDEMIQDGLQPDFATKLIVLRATALREVGKLKHNANENMVLERAEGLLAETVEASDRKDLAVRYRTSQAGTRYEAFEEVFMAGNFQFLVSLYGAYRAIERAAAIYDTYIQQSKLVAPDRSISAPRKMLTGLMKILRISEQYEEVDACWKMALEKSKILAARADADLKQAGWVLPARRHILSRPLTEYMHALIEQRRRSDMEAVISSLNRDGFALDSRNWNLYVQSQILFGDTYAAFETCEKELIEGWPGWPAPTTRRSVRHILGKLKWWAPTDYEGSRRMPEYKTMVMLARAYMELRQTSALSETVTEDLSKLMDLAPVTVREVNLMPRMNDPTQVAYLSRR